MMASQRIGNRYLAGLAMAFAVLFFVVGTLGPAHRSPYYFAIVPVPAVVALVLGWRGWTAEKGNSVGYSATTLGLLLAVLVFSHLLPRAHG